MYIPSSFCLLLTSSNETFNLILIYLESANIIFFLKYRSKESVNNNLWD